MSKENRQIADIGEDFIEGLPLDLLKILLQDFTKSSSRKYSPIFWATDDYRHLGPDYAYDKPILPELITGKHGKIVQPRIVKSKTVQTARSKEMAEVFTPSWICNLQNNQIDAVWFEREDVFNREILGEDGKHSWMPTTEKVEFPAENSEDNRKDLSKDWKAYITDVRIEISCGEAPYVVSRYDATTISVQHKVWDKVIAENIFVICKTPMAASITRRTLMGFRKGTVNSRSFENLETVIAKNPDDFVDCVHKLHFWKETSSVPKNFKEDEMKFDAVVGNPPYQTMANGDANGSDPIYHRFIDVAKKMAPLGTLIHPARFLFNAGKTPKDWNEKILNDEHFKVVKYYAKSTDVFPTVDIKGGVAITLFDAQTNFGKIGTFSAYQELSSILKKVVDKNFKTFADLVYPRDLYHLTETLYKENPWAESRPSKGHRYDVGSNIFEIFPELFFDEKPDDGEEYAGILGREKSSRNLKWIKKKYLKLPDNFDAYKIFVPKANGTGAIGEVLSTPVVGRPVVGHTLTFLSIGKFKTKLEAESCLKYIKTRFARAMLGTLKVTQDNSRETWANVPLQDFTPNSDIDWSKSIDEIDAQLNIKYKLNADEIDFIRTHVRAME